MKKTIELMREEIREEAVITKRVLDRIPGDKLGWKPHQKSMSLGQLGLHIANIPGNLARITSQDEFDVAQANFNPPAAASLGEIHSALEQSVKQADEFLGGLSEHAAQGSFRLMSKGKQVFSRPRVSVLRSIMLNHWYHHRGQLSVYLRMLEVPVPVIYGRSADESPFG